MTAVNPFSSQDRDHFPDFDAVFKPIKTTPSNKQQAFRWSIDQLAQLKPVDIGTSPASLVHALSPHDNPESQAKVEKFFSQKSIHPSPWLLTKTVSKHVTFSPHPPMTNYFAKEQLPNKSDAATQTSLSIPMDIDLEQLLGPVLYSGGCGEDNSFNLRRRLFGGPLREGGSCSYDCPSGDNDVSRDSTQLSSTPLRSPFSPSDLLHGDNGMDPLASSFLGVAKDEAPPTFSPISKDNAVTPPKPMSLSPISENNNFNESPENSAHLIKPILKRNFCGSPHCPELKHYCNYRPELSQISSDEGGEGEEGVPPLEEHQYDLITPSTACTTYFNNIELGEEGEKPVHSLMSSWQPPINSTMFELPTKSVTVVDSGIADTRGLESHDNHMISHMTTDHKPSDDDGINMTHSTATPTHMTPPSRYNTSVGVADPLDRDIVRRKNFLKGKLNVANLDKNA